MNKIKILILFLTMFFSSCKGQHKDKVIWSDIERGSVEVSKEKILSEKILPKSIDSLRIDLINHLIVNEINLEKYPNRVYLIQVKVDTLSGKVMTTKVIGESSDTLIEQNLSQFFKGLNSFKVNLIKDEQNKKRICRYYFCIYYDEKKGLVLTLS